MIIHFNMIADNYFEGGKEDVTFTRLLEHIKSVKEQNKSIIIKKGVFDLLHADHIKMFMRMKHIADHVIILTISDHNTSIIKPGRPIIPEYARIQVLKSIRYIDYVQTDYSSVDSETGKYSRLVDAQKLKLLGVDKFVLSDKTSDLFSGYDIGDTETIVIPEGSNFSTTGIVQKIRQSS